MCVCVCVCVCQLLRSASFSENGNLEKFFTMASSNIKKYRIFNVWQFIKA